MKILPHTAPYPFTLASLLGVSEHVVVHAVGVVCGGVVSWSMEGRSGLQVAHPSPTAPGRCLHFECLGAPARVRAWRCEGRPPLPHHFVSWTRISLFRGSWMPGCVDKWRRLYLSPILTLPSTRRAGYRRERSKAAEAAARLAARLAARPRPCRLHKPGRNSRARCTDRNSTGDTRRCIEGP